MNLDAQQEKVFNTIKIKNEFEVLKSRIDCLTQKNKNLETENKDLRNQLEDALESKMDYAKIVDAYKVLIAKNLEKEKDLRVIIDHMKNCDNCGNAGTDECLCCERDTLCTEVTIDNWREIKYFGGKNE